jgi:hypothetical protein
MEQSPLENLTVTQVVKNVPAYGTPKAHYRVQVTEEIRLRQNTKPRIMKPCVLFLLMGWFFKYMNNDHQILKRTL